MTTIYPSSPNSVPANLIVVTESYKRNAWLAIGGLVLFVLLYLCLAGWFAWQAWRLGIGALRGTGGFVPLMTGAAAAFLAAFMLKALVSVRQGKKSGDIEVSARDQPDLFDFLNRLADEAGAPRPHRVFLSARVNASLFYDLSFKNFFLPTHKNLEIGLGLVNVLNLGELKAVLAHEFGHFSQRTIAVSRWLYIAQQIAEHLVTARGKLDRFLDTFSHADIRIAWIVWPLSLIVWSIRSLLASVFRLVQLAQRALSREMEMQADLVAVSLTGSDALVHALHRMQVADDAWERTVGFAEDELRAGRRSKDMFALQSRIIEHMRIVLDDPNYGKEPAGLVEQAQTHRIFVADMVRPPQMWATHPLNHEREANAKRIYIAAPGDSRSAWALFDKTETLRERISSHLLRYRAHLPPMAELATSLQILDERFQHEYLDSAYRGMYLGRSTARSAREIGELYDRPGAPSLDALASLYPESLTRQLEQLRELGKEKDMLEFLHSGAMTASSGEIRHRGRPLRRRQLPAAIAQVQAECEALEKTLDKHDRQCRSLHHAIAAQLGEGWEAYLLGLTAILHYTEHSEANLRDAHGVFGNAVAMERVDGKAGAKRIVAAANALYAVINEIYHRQWQQVVPDSALLARLKIARWSDVLGRFDVYQAHQENINEWLTDADGWVNAIASSLANLRRAALAQLLQTEAKLAEHFRAATAGEAVAITPAPSPAQVPSNYPILLPGMERKRQARLGWWKRFEVADGPVAGTARLLVAGGIIGMVLGFSGQAANIDLTIYNGLGTAVIVRIDDQTISVDPKQHATLSLPLHGSYQIESRTADQRLIESFKPEVGGALAHYIYNVAAATPMVEATVNHSVYDYGLRQRPYTLDAQRWFATSADDLFEKRPQMHAGKGDRIVLRVPDDDAPASALAMLNNDSQRQQLILAHARWDSEESSYIVQWLQNARSFPEFKQIIAARLHDRPDEVINLLAEQEWTGDDVQAACARNTERARLSPGNANLQYVAARCIDDGNARFAAIRQGAARWPENGWFAMEMGHIAVGEHNWPTAIQYWQKTRAFTPSLALEITESMARLYRLQGQAIPTALVQGSPTLQLFMRIEQDGGPREFLNGEMLAFKALRQGNIDELLKLIERQQPSVSSHLLRLAAASSNADPALVKRAFALPTSDINLHTIWPMLALAAREHADDSAYLPLLDKLQVVDKDALLSFRQALMDGMPPQQAEPLLNGVHFSALGHAYCLGTIMLGDKAPPDWRDKANRLLFAAERPYLGT